MAFIYLILATGLAFLMYPYFDLPNIIMVYLLGVMATAIHWRSGAAILNSLLSVLAFDFCFVPPRWSFTVKKPNTRDLCGDVPDRGGHQPFG